MNRNYYQIIDVTDFGPFITKLVLGMPVNVCREEIRADQFHVYVEIKDKKGEQILLPRSFIEKDEFIPSKGYRPVTKAYPSDIHGEEKTEGSYVTLEMPYGPVYPCSSAIAADYKSINGFNSYTVSQYRITQIAPIKTEKEELSGLVFDFCAGVSNPKTERFRIGRSRDEKEPMNYGYFIPQKLQGKHPLIIFLHGAGEGGFDIPIPWSANKVTNFTEDWVQEKFGGALVLVPQCPTMWLDDGSHTYGDSGRSMYTKALMSLIREFVEDHSQVIDKKRIYIGGDSNGGFMTMRMLMSYPRYFAAAFPICEAMIDRRVSDRDIEHLKNIPIWFTHSADDPVVLPENYVLPTYHRLMQAGAENVHFTYWDEIRDIHEGFLDENGEPYRYIGHFAWIPMFNDDCRLDFNRQPVTVDGKEVSLMDWMALQKKQ